MYKKLKIELATDKIDFRKSSCFQGALFELMDTDYVSILHNRIDILIANMFIKTKTKYIGQYVHVMMIHHTI